MSSDLVKAYLAKGQALQDTLKERLGGRWGDGERIISAALLSENVADLFTECSEGEKSRLGICFYAVHAWEQFRAKLLEPVERSLISSNSMLYSMSKEIKELRESIVSDRQEKPAVATKEELDELRLTISKEFLVLRDLVESVPRSVKIPEPPASVDLSAIEDKLDTLRKAQAERDEQILAAKKARELREAADAKAKAERRALAEEQLVLKKGRKAEKKLRQKKARAAKLERVKMLKEGKNPYSAEEEAAFKAKLEAKGKKFFSFEDRAAKRADLAISEAKVKPLKEKSFKRYSAKEKADFIEKNFTKKGRKYYTPAERAAYKLNKNLSPAQQFVPSSISPVLPPVQKKAPIPVSSPVQEKTPNVPAPSESGSQASTPKAVAAVLPVAVPVPSVKPWPLPLAAEGGLASSSSGSLASVVASVSPVLPPVQQKAPEPVPAPNVPERVPRKEDHIPWCPKCPGGANADPNCPVTVFGPWDRKYVHHEIAWDPRRPTMFYLATAPEQDFYVQELYVAEGMGDQPKHLNPREWLRRLDDY